MSFILDALRKSEHERQKQTGPNIAHPYVLAPRPRFGLSAPWTIGIAALLVINLAVVLTLTLRGDDKQTRTESASPPVRISAPVAAAPLSPPATPAASTASSTAATQPQNPPAPLAAPAPAPVPDPELMDTSPAQLEAAQTDTASLPTINELDLKGGPPLPELHLDIHVYAAKPEERFVFINMRKYQEGGATPEGIRVERITPEGAVLNRNGLRFMLPRQ